MSDVATEELIALPLPGALLDALAERVAERLEAREPMVSEPWIGVEDAAEHLSCKPQRIYDLVSRNEIPYRRDGRRVLFRRLELDAWLERPPAA